MGLYGLDVIALLALVAFNFSLSTGKWNPSRQKKFKGSLEPRDPDVCVTQSITFTSTLLEDPAENHSIGFGVKNTSTDGTYVAIDDARVKIINQTTAQFTVNNVTFDTTDVRTSYYFHVRSYYWEHFASLDDSLMLGETSMARVFPLVDVKDFTCIVHNYTNMMCSWNYGDNYGENMPAVIFKWRIPAHSASWNDCNKLNVEEGFCKWEDAYFKDSNLTINITLVHKCSINVTSNFYEDTTKIVKPSPVSKLSATVYSSKCVHVSWETSKLYQFDQEVVVSSKYDTVSIKFNTSLGRNRTICTLHPFTMYNFSVRVRPTGRYAGYWSEPRNAEVVTYSDVPSASPSTVEGGYWFNRMECEGINLTRRVCVFWTPIKKEEENGPMTSIQGLFRSKGKQRQVNWPSNSTYGCSELMCNTTYDVTIRAENVNGTSKLSSTLKIPNYRRDLAPPQFIVESINMSDVYISLEKDQTFTGGFTVAWCRNKNGQCEPTQEVRWERVLSNTSQIILPNHSSAHDFLYGVSGSTETGRTGVVWQGCVYNGQAVPKREPKNVQVSRGSEDNTLLVTWDKLSCETDEPYIAHYDVIYCKQNGENKKSMTVSASGEARVELIDLESDQTYLVTVRGVTKEGHFGPESQIQRGVPVNKRDKWEFRYNIPPPINPETRDINSSHVTSHHIYDGLTPSEIIGIAMGVLVCVLFAGVGIFCVIGRCKTKAKFVLKRAAEITIPDIPDENLNIRRENRNGGACAKGNVSEDRTNMERTENNIGLLINHHHENDLPPTETTALKSALSPLTSDMSITEMIHDQTLELENEPRVHIGDSVAFSKPLEVIVRNPNRELSTENGSTKDRKDRSSDYVKCNQASPDSDSDKIKNKAVDRCAIDESKCEISADDFPRDDCGLQNVKNDSYIQLNDAKLPINFQSSWEIESSEGSSFIGEDFNHQMNYRKCSRAEMKVPGPIETQIHEEVELETNGYVIRPNEDPVSKMKTLETKGHVLHPIGAAPIKGVAHETNEYVLHPAEVPVSEEVALETKPITAPVLKEVVNVTNGYVLHPIETPVSIELAHEPNDYMFHIIDNPISKEVERVPNGYVLHPIKAPVSKEVAHETNGYVFRPIEPPVSKGVEQEPCGYVLHPTDIPVSKEVAHETNGYVSHPIVAPVSKEVAHETNGYVFRPIEHPVSKVVEQEPSGYVLHPTGTPVSKEVAHEANDCMFHKIDTPVSKEVKRETNGYVLHPFDCSVLNGVASETYECVPHSNTITDFTFSSEDENYVPHDVIGQVNDNKGTSTTGSKTSVSCVNDADINLGDVFSTEVMGTAKNCEHVGYNVQLEVCHLGKDNECCSNQDTASNDSNGYVPHSVACSRKFCK